jgi:plasmid stabilization system protein ParE
MNYELLLTRETEASVEQIIDYLAKRSPQGAVSWCEQWENVLAALKLNPLQHGLAPESAEYAAEIRQILFKTRRGRKYRALFTVVGRGVYVVDLRGPSQNLLRRSRLRRQS